MINKIDPKSIIKKADALLEEIESANKQFVKDVNKNIKDINQTFNKISDIDIDIQKSADKAEEKSERQVLNYLHKSNN